MFDAISMGLMAAYVAYRLSLTVRKIQAHRHGDVEREQQLSARGFALFIGVGFGVVMFFVAWIAFTG